ncbi:MAG: peptide chain release factor 1, partial [Clostridia bacterium]|nr:peptide chain release factor 1 [Clostridia bacterium]
MFRWLMREHAELSELAAFAAEFRALDETINSDRELAAAEDPELAEMAREELQEL